VSDSNDHGQAATIPATNESTERRGARTVVWIIFGIIFGLLPIYAEAIKEASDFTWHELLANKELLVISAVLSTGALGELLYAGSPKKGDVPFILAASSCAGSAIADTLFYGITPTSPGSTMTFFSSIFGFAAAALMGAVAIWISEQT
jgi:hypothetical protein